MCCRPTPTPPHLITALHTPGFDDLKDQIKHKLLDIADDLTDQNKHTYRVPDWVRPWTAAVSKVRRG